MKEQEFRKDCYWYHSDHLGSSSWITYTDGHAVQHLHYLSWGEDFVNQRRPGWNAMYTFSAKEKDAETGYSYFGARYYSSEFSIWLSVDPMAHKYPSLSPYVYCANNPIKLVDPNGEEVWIVDGDCSYKYLNGKLYTKDGSEYTAKENSFAYKTVNSLNQIKNGGEVGNAMISELESSTSFSVNIIDAGEGKSAYNNGTIRWNTHGQEVPTTAGLKSDALIGLAHELAHGVDEKRGTFNTEKTKENSWIGNHEWKAVYTENQIRMEQGKPFRTHYEIDNSDPTSPKGSGPKMINTANRITNFRLPQGVSPLF